MTDNSSLPNVPSFFGGSEKTGDRSLPLFNPYTERPWATMTDAGDAMVNAAYDDAERGLAQWQSMSGDARGALMHDLSKYLTQRAKELGTLESTDNGKPIRETQAQMGFAARNFRYFAGLTDKIFGSVVPMDKTHLFDYYTREPHGVCALVVAWNSPMQLTANKVAPALACGNTVVIKPSELACASVVELARMATEVGFPPGVINVVTGGPATGESVVTHPKAQMISLTGGVSTGRKVARAAAERIVPLVLELGGKSPQLVFEDANIEKAVVGVMAGVFGAAGQTCMAGSRLYVAQPIYEEFLTALRDAAAKIRLGDPLDSATEMGPVISSDHGSRIIDAIQTAVAEGATVVLGGERVDDGSGSGFFVAPTILADVSNEMKCVKEEIFGPVLSISSFKDESDAVALANDTEYGLAAGIWTENITRAMALTRAIRAGTVWVNTYRAVSAGGPFGGFGMSGYGRERSVEAIREYTRTKNVVIEVSDQDARRDPFVIGV